MNKQNRNPILFVAILIIFFIGLNFNFSKVYD
jgi:hypothetical protein